MVKIVPAILAKDVNSFYGNLKKVTGNFTQIQVDICTSDFVGFETLEISEIEIPKETEVGWHLMSNSFREYRKLLEFNTVNIIVHFESGLRREILETQINKKIKWGLAVNPDTDIHRGVEILGSYDFIQLMGVMPGAQGQQFNPSIVEKIKWLTSRNFKKPIWIDGGINETSVEFLKGLGVDVLVVGSYLLDGTDILVKKEILEKSFSKV